MCGPGIDEAINAAAQQGGYVGLPRPGLQEDDLCETDGPTQRCWNLPQPQPRGAEGPGQVPTPTPPHPVSQMPRQNGDHLPLLPNW